MAVTEEDVRRVAELARLGLEPARVEPLVQELNGILGHMAVLEAVDTGGVGAVQGVGAAGMPLRVDHGPKYPLARSLDQFAPATREGFLLVPRLSTHEHLEGADADADDERSEVEP
ncbi:MAG: Asp-tRNA(Asn)/Glu-tRNA(Gln) amidotransferase subunit GatC [Gemmatimonadaceae bacterium]